MTREEIYNKIQAMCSKEIEHLNDRVQQGTLDADGFLELANKRTREYQEWEQVLALTNDNELEEKLGFIINANLEKF
jgi:hypothetical protein